MKITRRAMLSTAAAVGMSPAALAAISPTKPAQFDGAIAPRLRLSLCGYSLRDYLSDGKKPGKMTYDDFLELAAAWGLDAVELTSYYFPSEDKEYLHALKAKAFKLGLDISGAATNNNFCYPAGANLDESLAHTRKWIDNAAELGAPVLRVFAGNKVRDIEDVAAVDNVIAGMKTASDYAAERGVFLALENHGYLTDSADSILHIVQSVNNPWFGINLDTGHFKDAPYESMIKVLPHTVTLHAKTMITENGERKPADYDRIAKLLRDANYRGYIALEYEEKDDPMIAVPRIIEALRKSLC